ncbi:MAG: HigA family addiction module antitoxin [Chloroflexota bacterium]
MIRIPTHRAPTHPGEMLQEEFLKPMNLSALELANAIRVPAHWIDEIVDERRSVTASIALRLEQFFGMSAGFWLNMQIGWDLYMARQTESDEIQAIPAYAFAAT